MGFFSDLIGGITGSTGRRAARDSASQQMAAGQQAIGTVTGAAQNAQGFLSPFQQIGQQGLAGLDFLGNSQNQFDFLQNNPLFQLALDNANQATMAQSAAGGRLAAGDTLSQLSNNVLLSAQPLIDRQRQDIFGMLGMGTNLASQQAGIETGLGSNIANLQTGIGAAQAAGTIGAANATAGGLAGSLGGVIGGGLSSALGKGISNLFSDPRLKEDIKMIGNENGYNIYSWVWNKLANERLKLFGSSSGVMYPDVLERNPEATSIQRGFGKVNYSMIGVNHGARS